MKLGDASRSHRRMILWSSTLCCLLHLGCSVFQHKPITPSDILPSVVSYKAIDETSPQSRFRTVIDKTSKVVGGVLVVTGVVAFWVFDSWLDDESEDDCGCQQR